MSDLAEVQRFWPWMRGTDSYGTKRPYFTRMVRGVRITVTPVSAAYRYTESWLVDIFDNSRGCRSFYNGPTIAAAMAAAGFGVRIKGPFAYHNSGCSTVARAWQQGPLPDYRPVPPVTRQRPRKGVRLGKARRDDAEFDARFADAMANALFSNPILSMLQMLGNP